MQTNKIIVAKIVSAHGIRGFVKIRSFSQPPEAILDFQLELEDHQPIKLKKQGLCKDGIICSIKNVQDRNQAELLAGMNIFTLREDLPQIDEEEFYIADLVGCDIFEKGSQIGKIIAVHNFGAGDVIEVQFAKDSAYFPFKSDIFPSIDIDKKIVEFIKPK